MSSNLLLMNMARQEKRTHNTEKDMHQGTIQNIELVGSPMILKTSLNPMVGDLLQLLDIREPGHPTSVLVIILLFLIHLESPTGSTLTIQLLMDQSNIIITIGFQLRDLATVVMMGGEIMNGNRNPLSSLFFGWPNLHPVTIHLSRSPLFFFFLDDSNFVLLLNGHMKLGFVNWLAYVIPIIKRCIIYWCIVEIY